MAPGTSGEQDGDHFTDRHVADAPEGINLWAGTGHRHATDEPAGAILARLGSRV